MTQTVAESRLPASDFRPDSSISIHIITITDEKNTGEKHNEKQKREKHNGDML